ncbi:YfbM family protein [Shimia sp. Alg240-R146]|uniref:YfbM family protein n=1 Tax=Shimia sp. Alg240-R146 TaxID=2993449 RepID=UPI0022E00C55|nr:YfbM family protein [Shimia sp. Alg240-R146]
MSMTMQIFAVPEDQLSAEQVNNFLRENLYGEDALELEKEWAALDHMLPNFGQGAFSALRSGAPIGDDWGYGPALALNSEGVKAFLKQLQAVSKDEFAQKFSFDDLAQNDIYPAIWDRKDPDDKHFVLETYQQLREFTKAAADHGQALLTVIL